MPQWLVIVNVVLEVLKLFKKQKNTAVVEDLKNAKSKDEKQAALNQFTNSLFK